MDLFEIAAGSIVGRRHVGSGNLLIGKNNQDSLGVLRDSNYIVATVYDGCSSSIDAEVGAKIAARILPGIIASSLDRGQLRLCGNLRSIDKALEEIRIRFLQRMRAIVWAIAAGDAPSRSKRSKEVSRQRAGQIVHDAFLFTVVAAVVTHETSIVFSAGDGFYAVNGVLEQLGPFADNAPPYLLYGDSNPQARFSLDEVLDTKSLQSLMLATDGLQDLVDKTEQNIPGKREAVGELSRLWSDDRFFAAGVPISQRLTPWLRSLNSEVVKRVGVTDGHWELSRERGLLQDDLTIVSIRRTVPDLENCETRDPN
jgi:hypothetical protein